MSVEPELAARKDGTAKKRPALRLWVLAAALGLAVFYGWVLWPSDADISPYDLSREDGKSRFYVTTYPKMTSPQKQSLPQRLLWSLVEYQRRHRQRNPTAYTFPASKVQSCSIQGLLNQCMEVTGTQYSIAVEVCGSVEFGHTNSLNGAQWVAAFEHAIEVSDPVICYDYRKKGNFRDTLLVFRERPGVVKIVPRSKLAAYQEAGLVERGPR
jgi:hypothetical protein